ncbi:anti-sigma factor family protein [Sulfurirhabdus autotrophica]|uniref:Anti-sigma factor RsiW n=1 Tax=Sulfurirhabdus autotrophica TaxID=1706046 RepID=A0A4R3YE19_9PROT|nr:anti-sigma factor [Sulfurirhabdus autotrophica]TCV90316.1 anti-sigma factor RsiW [Sulfurirhabdus autotrophica]
MDCKEILALLPAYVDQELGVSESIEVDNHVLGCLSCQNELASQNALRGALKKHATYFKAPNHLENHIRAALPLDNAHSGRSGKPALKWLGPFNWFSFGTAITSVVALTLSVSFYLAIPSPNDLLAEDVVSNHVRSLMVNHIADVTSSDHHTVKPWFNGKLDFSPTVSDLTAQGFPLVGGRLDYLDHRSVAALVYRHRQHLINVYIWPVANKQNIAVKTLSSQGYQLLHWAEGGMVYWVVSDLNPRELLFLALILQAQGSQGSS